MCTPDALLASNKREKKKKEISVDKDGDAVRLEKEEKPNKTKNAPAGPLAAAITFPDRGTSCPVPHLNSLRVFGVRKDAAASKNW